MQVFEGEVGKANFYRHLEQDYDGSYFWAMNPDVVNFVADDDSVVSVVLRFWKSFLSLGAMLFPDHCASIKFEKWFFVYKGNKYYYLFNSTDLEWLFSKSIIESLEVFGCSDVFFQMGVYD